MMTALFSSAVPYKAAALEPADQKADPQKKTDPAKPLLQVNGKVVDRNAKGLANADVKIQGASGAPATKKSGADGTFSFELPAGAYKAVAAKSGKESEVIPFELTKKTDLKELVVDIEH